MKNPFDSQPLYAPSSSRFDLSHDIKTTFDLGKLVPALLIEALPGDSFKIACENFIRLQPMVVPPMHLLKMITDFYFVPNRILKEDFLNWIAGNIIEAWPSMNLTELTVGSVGDYFGLPIGYQADDFQMKISPFPIAAYYRIYDSWYRDENLQAEIFQPVVSGDNPYYENLSADPPLNRAWMRDYFTAGLPWAQKGNAVTLPLTDSNELTISRRDNPGGDPGVPPYAMFRRYSDNAPASPPDAIFTATTSGGRIETSGGAVYYDPSDSLVVDVNNAAVTINSFRRAMILQEYLERLARGGSRDTEYLRVMWNVISSDSRLQRPEFIGRHTQSVVISEVLSQAETLNAEDQIVTVVGDMKGKGTSFGNSRTFRYYAEEYGYVIGIVNVQPTTAYSQGVDRHWTREDPLEYPNPTFAGLGEQEITLGELWADGTVDHKKLFAYIPRYSEMRYQTSKVTADFRTTQRNWAWTREFETEPELNEDFIRCVPRTDMFAVEEEGSRHLIAHLIYHVNVDRRLPKHGVPAGIG